MGTEISTKKFSHHWWVKFHLISTSNSLRTKEHVLFTCRKKQLLEMLHLITYNKVMLTKLLTPSLFLTVNYLNFCWIWRKWRLQQSGICIVSISIYSMKKSYSGSFSVIFHKSYWNMNARRSEIDWKNNKNNNNIKLYLFPLFSSNA